MAVPKRNTIHLVPRRRRNTNAQLRAKIEMQQLFIDVLCWAKPDPVHSLKRSQRLQIADVCRKTGMSYEDAMQRCADLWLEVEAPVYMN